MKKGIFIAGLSCFLLIGCSSNKKVSPEVSNAPQKPPQAISCKDYCKQQCQGLAQSCETNCLNACYPTP